MTLKIHDAPFITILSPVYGCRDCLKELVERVRSTFEDKPFDWELLLVDDRGPDKPWELICSFAEQDPRVRGIRLARNHGQHLAIWAGLEAARGDWIAVIDCDLQDDPAVIPELLEIAINSSAHAVIVERGIWLDSQFRRLASTIFYRIVKILGGVHLKNIGNFGLYGRPMVDALVRFREQEVFLPMMVALTGLETTTHRVDRSGRAAGTSSYSFKSLVRLAIAVTIRFSDRPLKLSVLLGLAFSGVAGAISIFLFVAWLLGIITVPGWTSTVLSMWFLSGMIMATLGVHGFYLGRIFSEVKARPRITIDATTGSGAPSDIP